MEKIRTLVIDNLNEWCNWLVHHVPKTVQRKVSSAFNTLKDKIECLWRKITGKETSKGFVAKEAEKKHQEKAEKRQEGGDIDLTAAFNKVYKSFSSPGSAKTDTDTNIDRILPYMRALVEQQIKEMGSAKIQLCMWIKWKKTKEMVIQLNPEEFEQAENIFGEGHDVIVEKAFNSKMMEVESDSGRFWRNCLPSTLNNDKSPLQNTARGVA